MEKISITFQMFNCHDNLFLSFSKHRKKEEKKENKRNQKKKLSFIFPFPENLNRSRKIYKLLGI